MLRAQLEGRVLPKLPAAEHQQLETGHRCRGWAGRFRGLQDLLGELHDLEVLRRANNDQLAAGTLADLPILEQLLEQNCQRCWQRWGLEATDLQRPHRRLQLWRDVLRESIPGWRRPCWDLARPSRPGAGIEAKQRILSGS